MPAVTGNNQKQVCVLKKPSPWYPDNKGMPIKTEKLGRPWAWLLTSESAPLEEKWKVPSLHSSHVDEDRAVQQTLPYSGGSIEGS